MKSNKKQDPYTPPSDKKVKLKKKDISYTITAEGYASKEFIPYKGDGTIKPKQIHFLNPIEKEIEIDKIKSSQLDKDQIIKLSSGINTPDYYVQEKLVKKIQELKTVVIPLLITLAAKFGITKVTELVNKNKDEIKNHLAKVKLCPSKLELNKIIKTKNKLVKIIQSILKIINKAIIALGITEGLLIILDLTYQVLKNLPIPTSTGVPGVPGLPTSLILGFQDSKDKLDKKIKLFKKINESILGILILLKSILELVLKLLNLIDMLLQLCVQEDKKNNQEEKDPEKDPDDLLSILQNLTLQSSNQQSPSIINVNGFVMGTETEPQITSLSIKRKRAIATNKQGVVMLKGEWSFSSIDQILIDELVFYIQTNDLRAD